MAFINWDESFIIEIDFIDRQHKKLVTLVNNLYDAMQQGREKYILNDIMLDLVAYTQEHFATEERVFDQIKYPDALEHKKEHADLVAKVAKFKSDFDSGKGEITKELFEFLKSWLKEHIKGSDLRYVAHFKANDVF